MQSPLLQMSVSPPPQQTGVQTLLHSLHCLTLILLSTVLIKIKMLHFVNSTWFIILDF